MSSQLRIGVMQLTMEPLEEMLESARVMDQSGMDTIWLAEAYPWWRKHGMEARSSTVVSALMARETERLTIGWGIISPFTRPRRSSSTTSARRPRRRSARCATP
jgi:alkanesulfonate monooxygenase SsuD/methylene tetrahydromethanopterin reductase-like flavin-dependent oxidoreductase (luciferase family)